MRICGSSASIIKRYSLPRERLQRHHQTPERMTIEKPLYFCSRKFVGQFTRVMRVAVSAAQRAVADACLLCSTMLAP
jgi:hypothetical protein